MFTEKPHHIIAIGASAGGNEDVNIFFDHAPISGASYIVVQHISVNNRAQLLELLSKQSNLEVEVATEGMFVKRNHVYIVPDDKPMIINDKNLFIKHNEKIRSLHKAINIFFNSLADIYGHSAIGIILSGSGEDGSEGIKAIKREGGLIIARSPQNSKYRSMPSSAIATGMVDFVLEPELMPETIENYINHGNELLIDLENDDKKIVAIIDLIKESLPLDFSEYKLSTILRRTKRRAAIYNINTLENYLEFLKSTPDEIEVLAKDFLIKVTSFFRDQEAFEIIQTHIFPDIIDKLSHGEEFKMWVAGCATGEEVFSFAILLAEILDNNLKNIKVKIFATDIDSQALFHASKGVYSLKIAQNVSTERLENFFLKEGKNFRIKPEIRKMVIFAKHDITKNPPYCNMNFISCRNLLIYLSPVLQKKIYTMLLFGLKLNGDLFLGSTETPISIINSLKAVSNKWKIYKKVEAKRTIRFDAFTLPDLFYLDQNPLHLPIGKIKNSNISISEAVNEILVSDLNILLVCIDEDNNVLKSYGDTYSYLLQKNFTSNIVDLLPEPLAGAFQILKTKVSKINKKQTINRIVVNHNQKINYVSLSINPLIKNNNRNLLMVTFSQSEKTGQQNVDSTTNNEVLDYKKYTSDLEEELKVTKNKLINAHEHLNSFQENMQSFNEEIISANEELLNTHEEMQILYNELDLVNSNYKLKNKELVTLNDDLNNYFRSNINGQLFISHDLILIKYSPGTVKQINISETDIGKPLSNLSTNIKFKSIIEDIRHTITYGSIISKEIETDDGKWFQLMTMPYIQQSNNEQNGAIVTLNDITELKKTQLELDKKNKSLVKINEDLDHFVYSASHDLLDPLSTIEGSIEVINLLKVIDPEVNKFLTVIKSSIKKFRSLITDIATIAKMESDLIIIEKIDLHEILNNIEWGLENKIKQSGAVITRDLQVSKIQFSKKNIRSILYNLISNGIKYRREENPIIKVHSSIIGENILIYVMDNGKGIPESEINKVFKIYGRLDYDIEGQGIGLYLTKKMINAANGSIYVESELGKGSKFIIHLKHEGYEA